MRISCLRLGPIPRAYKLSLPRGRRHSVGAADQIKRALSDSSQIKDETHNLLPLTSTISSLILGIRWVRTPAQSTQSKYQGVHRGRGDVSCQSLIYSLIERRPVRRIFFLGIRRIRKLSSMNPPVAVLLNCLDFKHSVEHALNLFFQ